MARIKYTKGLLQEAVDNSVSVMDVLRYLNLRLAGGTHSHISRKLQEFEIDTSHFVGQSYNLGKASFNKKSASDILIRLPEGSRRPRRPQLHRALKDSGIPYKCSECPTIGEWNGKPIVLEIDHIDGDWLNNTIENLRYLCPNCHSQQMTSNRSWKYRV